MKAKEARGLSVALVSLKLEIRILFYLVWFFVVLPIKTLISR